MQGSGCSHVGEELVEGGGGGGEDVVDGETDFSVFKATKKLGKKIAQPVSMFKRKKPK